MAERRPLSEGLKVTKSPEDAAVERAFVFESREPARPPTATKESRSPINTRVRTDFAKALKRASLERQLQGVEPSTLQEILEEALEPWLRSHGYLS